MIRVDVPLAVTAMTGHRAYDAGSQAPTWSRDLNPAPAMIVEYHDDHSMGPLHAGSDRTSDRAGAALARPCPWQPEWRRRAAAQHAVRHTFKLPVSHN